MTKRCVAAWEQVAIIWFIIGVVAGGICLVVGAGFAVGGIADYYGLHRNWALLIFVGMIAGVAGIGSCLVASCICAIEWCRR